MHHDGPSSTLANDTQTAAALVRSISSGRGPHFRGACGRYIVSTREIRRRLWRAWGRAAAATAGRGLAITSIRSRVLETIETVGDGSHRGGLSSKLRGEQSRFGQSVGVLRG